LGLRGDPWHLDPTASTHFCLAVEISTPSAPIVAPSLLGRAPSWPTTDLIVINDNNKVQRNMGVYPASGTGRFSFFGIVHNAATFRRNVELRLEVSREKYVMAYASMHQEDEYLLWLPARFPVRRLSTAKGALPVNL
jgi:hypothetical protein